MSDKSAEEMVMVMVRPSKEWVSRLGNRIERQRYASHPALLCELVEQIQLDAYTAGKRAGMESAAGKCNPIEISRGLPSAELTFNGACVACSNAIITSANDEKGQSK